MRLSDEQNFEVSLVGCIVASISLVCSLLTLVVIKYMNVWNGHLLLITSMTIFQIFYDINYIIGIVNGFDACVAWNFLDTLGGLSVAFWTNTITFIVMYVVVNIRSFNIFKNYIFFFSFAGAIPFIVAVLMLFTFKHSDVNDDSPNLYCDFVHDGLSTFISNIKYWGRILSIIFNFVGFFYISYRVRKMTGGSVIINTLVKGTTAILSGTSHSTKSNASDIQVVTVNNPVSSGPGLTVIDNPPELPQQKVESGDLNISENQSLAVCALASRMKYYPIAQALCRIGAAWNEFNNYQYDNYTSNLAASVLSPMSGILYFLIFLIMQPKAYLTLKSMFSFQKTKSETPATDSETLFRNNTIQSVSDGDLEHFLNHENSFYSESFAWNTPSQSSTFTPSLFERAPTLTGWDNEMAQNNL